MWSLPIVRWAVLRTFSSWVRQCAGLTAEVDADDNGAALSGRLRAVTLAFDSLELRRGLLRTSRGAATITGLDLKLRALLLSPYRRLFQWRWLRAPIRVNGDYSLSQEDFASSKVIGNVVEKIVNALLRRLQRPILAQLRRARVLPPIGGDAAAALVLSSVERAEVTRARGTPPNPPASLSPPGSPPLRIPNPPAKPLSIGARRSARVPRRPHRRRARRRRLRRARARGRALVLRRRPAGALAAALELSARLAQARAARGDAERADRAAVHMPSRASACATAGTRPSCATSR